MKYLLMAVFFCALIVSCGNNPASNNVIDFQTYTQRGVLDESKSVTYNTNIHCWEISADGLSDSSIVDVKIKLNNNSGWVTPNYLIKSVVMIYNCFNFTNPNTSNVNIYDDLTGLEYKIVLTK